MPEEVQPEPKVIETQPPISAEPEPTEPEPTEEEMVEEVELAGERERIHPFDPDFLMVLSMAFLFDALDILFTIIQFLTGFTLGTFISWMADVVVLGIIGGWMFSRIQKIAQSKQQAVQTFKTTIEKAATFQAQIAKGIQSPLTRTLSRAGAGFIGELIPLVGLIPFWTITVVLTLREK